MSPRFPTLVVAIDLGPTSEIALRRADALAPSRLVVCHVVHESYAANPMVPESPAEAGLRTVDPRAWATGEVARQVERATGRSAGEYEVVIVEGKPDAAIVRVAEEERADLVVVSYLGRLGLARVGLTRLLLGSVAHRVVRAAPCPVLVARFPIAGGAVLAATDLSDPSIPAVRAAAAEASATGRRLVTLFCLERLPAYSSPALVGSVPYLPPEMIEEGRRSAEHRLGEVLEREHIESERQIGVGIAEIEIVETAAALAADLVVVGTHGRGGLTRLLLGSTAEAVLRDARCSVLVVRVTS